MSSTEDLLFRGRPRFLLSISLEKMTKLMIYMPFITSILKGEPMREFGRKGFSVHAKETEIALGLNFENFFKNRI